MALWHNTIFEWPPGVTTTERIYLANQNEFNLVTNLLSIGGKFLAYVMDALVLNKLNLSELDKCFIIIVLHEENFV